MPIDPTPDVADLVAVDLLRSIWTCRKTNTTEWMEWIVERMNAASEKLGRPERWEYRRREIMKISPLRDSEIDR